MDKRQLGNSDLMVTPLMFGGNVFGWTVDEPTSFQILDTFVGAGLNFIDTADVYSIWQPGSKGGESETIIGKWLQQTGKRAEVILATKVGMKMGDDKEGLRKDYILRAVEDSLQRLQTDYIDLYQSHQDDLNTPQEETLAAFAQLIEQGKVRVIGASNYSGERLTSAVEISKQHNYPSYQSLQPLYNLMDRDKYEQELEPVCEKYNIGVISYFSLARGFLSGKYRTDADFTKSVRGGKISNYLTDRGFRVLAALDQLSAQYNSTPATISLAWLMARPSITAPIASATNLKQLKDMLDAVNLKLDAAAIELLNQASAY